VLNYSINFIFVIKFFIDFSYVLVYIWCTSETRLAPCTNLFSTLEQSIDPMVKTNSCMVLVHIRQNSKSQCDFEKSYTLEQKQIQFNVNI
jgi:tRNA1(Val) A37 N6-methylase TrmN6